MGFEGTYTRDVAEDGSNVELDGWEVVESAQEVEGWYVTPEEGADENASATFSVNLPCEGRWRIWVRAYSGDDDDSFRVQVNDEPETPVTFDSDCGLGVWDGNGYYWRRLHSRDPEGSHCDNSREEWPTWFEAGEHEIKFMDGGGESVISSIKITNDLDYNP